MKSIFIVNPVAAHGTLKEKWEPVAEQLKKKIKNFKFEYTRAPRDGEKLTRKALLKGYRLIVAVGGDGTLNECLNGFLKKDKPVKPRSVLGVFPLGRGSDFARGLKIPRDPHQAIRHFLNEKTIPVDVGKITYQAEKGIRRTRYFMNIANVGIVPHVDNWSHKAPKILGPKGAYLYGSFRGSIEYSPPQVYFSTNNGRVKKTILNIVIANGSYFGSGMKVAPRARVDDGLFDIIVAEKMGLFQFFKHMPKLYSGKHLRIPQVDFFRAKKLSITPANLKGPVLVEMDGDTVGTLPASFEILPKAIKFKI